MKRAISLLLVLFMVLALGGCGDNAGQALYEKYAPIIDMLEAKDYQGAIRDITNMAIAEQRGEVEKVPVMQVLCNSTWYTTYEDAPQEITFSEDGTCTIGGETMNWLAEESWSETYLRLQISKDGKICRYVSIETGNKVPYVNLSFTEERDDGIYSGEGIGTYYNHPLMPYLLQYWYDFSDYETVSDVTSFSIGNGSASVNGDSCDWTLVNTDSQDSIVVHIDAKNEREGAYTATLTMRDGHPVMTFVDDATGESGLYYNGNSDGYEKTWIEYIYTEAMDNYNEYLRNGGFYCGISGTSYYDSDENAIGYLYDQFASLGDYADAVDILANWDAVKFSRAMRYLTRFEERSSFRIGETNYGWNLDTLAFIKTQFEEIASYPQAADVLNNWDSVLYNRAMYYLGCYINGDSLHFDNRSFYSSSENYNDALTYIYPMFAEISDYADAAAILDRFTIVENKYLSYNNTTLDHMGNENTNSTSTVYRYNELGQVIKHNNYNEIQRSYGVSSSNAYYFYDENGNITEVKLGSLENVAAVITPTYDANGNKISDHVVYNSGEHDVFYTYDDQNRLVEMRRPNTSYGDPEQHYYFYTYAYDDAGRVTEKRYGEVYSGYLEEEYVYAYTYDENGNQIRETETYTYYEYRSETINRTQTHTAECVCDELGNVIQKNWTYGNTVYRDGTENRHSYVSATYNYIYGNVYFFDATGMEVTE